MSKTLSRVTIFVYVVVVVVGLALIRYFINGLETFTDIRFFRSRIEIFTDSTGIEWRVLTEDENGNRLIITEAVHGIEPIFFNIDEYWHYPHLLVQYNSTNIYTPLSDSDGLKPVLNMWFDDILAPELRAAALPVENVDNDVRNSVFETEDLEIFLENEPEGWSRAGIGIATSENSLFILSISEVNKYESLGTLNTAGFYWLRSPGGSLEYPIAFMGVNDSTGAYRFSNTRATERRAFRPALWIKNE